MTLTLTWTPDPLLLTNLVKIADQKGQIIEADFSEAVELYLENQPTATINTQSDPLIGLFKGSPHLATESEEILNLYETDYLLWLEKTLEQVKNRQMEQLDWDNLAEEIEGLKISLHHQVDSYLRPLLIHLLLYQYWITEREKSGSDWSDKIYDLRDELANLLEYSKALYNYFVNCIDVIYPRARKSVILKTEFSPDTFPEQCPFSVEQILDLNFYPEL